ncbi:MAG: Gmad2 immunoglobulin-like domain-containing protein [Firmicutes bacterium]|uniref:Immunoglobulin-like domain of spore germination n=1 Tax=Melghirimyces thermohalophilus TaxID=1236220 RepID=A0A1G6RAB4_9BACL|nr:Gmad2 immunoglobulin-like domain-containing protein [Melghirimyces thermohalophilus]MDA8353048.1 Gmad2 immunoglobulin-like domain-containing protein [Bacillota bacterium]SDD01254.1 Immunoglobulin-like domain of spore germination [Melghirimyces thermohalophilus]
MHAWRKISGLLSLFLLAGAISGCSASETPPQQGEGQPKEEEKQRQGETSDPESSNGKKEKEEEGEEVREVADHNQAFRKLTVAGKSGRYTVRGQARVTEGQFRYAVSDGHNYLLEGSSQAQSGAPEWAAFQLSLDLPKAKVPQNGTLTLELFEISPKDGSRENEIVFPLENLQ